MRLPISAMIVALLLATSCGADRVTAQESCSVVTERAEELAGGVEELTAQLKAEMVQGKSYSTSTNNTELGDVFNSFEDGRRRQNEARAEDSAELTANLRTIQEIAILAEQNPSCFTPEQRAQIEARYREWKAAAGK
jgi:hypothetical protein